MMRRSVGERVENLFVFYVLFDCCIVEVVRGFVLCCVLGGWVVWGGARRISVRILVRAVCGISQIAELGLNLSGS